MKSILSLLIFAVCSFNLPPLQAQGESTPKTGISLDALITGDQLWETTPAQFEQMFNEKGLQWLSQDKDRARFFGADFRIFNGEIHVLEGQAEFQGGKLARVNLSLYNRGDSVTDPRTVAEFEKMLGDIKGIISARIGVQGMDRGKDAASAVKATGWAWSKAPTAFLLEYSYQKEMKGQGKLFRPEFVRLRVAPLPKQLLLGNSGATGNNPVSRNSLAANVTKETNGDVFIKTVPMVDQGPKGYCVVATTERVFKYLGLNVDQHEMAAIANSSSSGGTNPMEMVEALKKLTGRLKVRIRDLQVWTYADFNKMITDYNRAAKKNKKHEVNIDGMRSINIGQIYEAFDPDSLKESRATPGKGSYTKFQREVTDTLNRGLPLMWSVQLGLYKEIGLPQTGGGHMRLIIGYNLKTSEILYSDSWGAEHALKRMPMDDACAMTTGLYYLEPLQ